MADQQDTLEAMTNISLPKQGGSEAQRHGGDLLSDEQAKALLTSVSLIRDPLHGDIRVTKLERALIDTPEFQRLRHINQLAMVDVVYPGAVHNRFLHSLGVLHVCSEMIIACNNSAKTPSRLASKTHPIPVRIGPYAELLTRLVALLHDMAHVPFGHVFEREAQVFKKDEWEDTWRAEKVFGVNSPFFQTCSDFFVEQLGTLDAEHRLQEDDARAAARAVMDEVKAVLTANGSTVLDLRYPFVYDLVSNTICADLIDYVQRDMLFAGLTEGLGKRFMKYLAVMPTEFDRSASEQPEFSYQPYRIEEGHQHASEAQRLKGNRVRAAKLVLLLYSYNERQAVSPKPNVLAEAIDLVRRRKLVAEKLYFHKTKLVATAMLSAAAYASGIDAAEAIWDMSDREVLSYIAKSGDRGDDVRFRRAKALATKLQARHLFKPVYRVSYHPDVEDHTGRLLWHTKTGAYARFNNPKSRDELIARLEELIALRIENPELAIGSVAVSCPNKDMQLKAFKMTVLPSPDTPKLKPLQETVQPVVRKEIEAIQEGHCELWSLEVFVDPRVVNLESELANDLAGAIRESVALPNEIHEFRNATPRPIDELIREESVKSKIDELDLTDKIKHHHYTELIGGAARSSTDDIEARLRDWGYLDE